MYMIKTILLLNPVYVTLFWAIILNITSDKDNAARNFLGKFMIFAFVIYFSHYIFYNSFIHIYMYIDPIYQLSSLLVFPLYTIYLKILTTDNKFIFSIHLKYLIAPIILILLYIAGFFYTPSETLKLWLFNRSLESDLLSVEYLKIINILIKITFLGQLVYLMYLSSSEIRKFRIKIQEIYSDEIQGKRDNLQQMNVVMIITGCSSIILALLGREYFKDIHVGISIASITFSTLLFVVGYLGYNQISLQFNIKEGEYNNQIKENNEISSLQLRKLNNKMTELFEVEKVYLNENLTIMDIASITGTNRTYISHLINQNHNQNFCTFVNTYRLKEVRSYIMTDPDCTNAVLAEKCGFSSTDSLKRIVKNMTGKSVSELKTEITNELHKET